LRVVDLSRQFGRSYPQL